MYKDYFELQCGYTEEQKENLPEFLKVENIEGVFCKGDDYIVVDKKVFEQNRESKHPRYYKIELLEDNLFPYPVSAKLIRGDLMKIEFENGKVKYMPLAEGNLDSIKDVIKKENSEFSIEVKEHCIYINKNLWASEDIYFYCYANDRILERDRMRQYVTPPLPVIKNQIRCKRCGDIIESKSVHDFKFCSCGLCAVDGGHYYLRRTWTEGTKEDAFEELSICRNDVDR